MKKEGGRKWYDWRNRKEKRLEDEETKEIISC
jgi:hypothetical protein